MSSTFALPDSYEAYALNWDGDAKSDIFISAPNKGYLFTGATIMTRKLAGNPVVLSDRLFELAHDVVTNFAVRGVVAGDINGDGMDDLLFTDKANGVGNRVYVLLGRPASRLPGIVL